MLVLMILIWIYEHCLLGTLDKQQFHLLQVDSKSVHTVCDYQVSLFGKLRSCSQVAKNRTSTAIANVGNVVELFS